jgi:hypothetical protein
VIQLCTLDLTNLDNNPIQEVKPIQRVNYPRISEFYFAHMNPRTENYAIHTFLEDVSVYVKFGHFEKYNKKRGAHVIGQ